jgi:hypothetical protein
MSKTNTLTWAKNTEADMAGYNVYRKLGAAPVKGVDPKLNTSLVPKDTTTYADVVMTDGDYFYEVSAVDTAGNESAFSVAVDIVVNVVPPQAPTGLTVA